MTPTVLAISAAYVGIAVLLLAMALTSRFAWWVKAVAIVVTSAFFVEAFFSTKGLLGWPREGQLPPRFELLWVRVVEPDTKSANPGAVYLWIEAVDDNNVPDGVPQAYRLPYSRPLADRSLKARDEIMSGKPQQGSAAEIASGDDSNTSKDNKADQPGARAAPGATAVDADQFRLLQQAQRVEFSPMPGPTLPPKGP